MEPAHCKLRGCKAIKVLVKIAGRIVIDDEVE